MKERVDERCRGENEKEIMLEIQLIDVGYLHEWIRRQSDGISILMLEQRRKLWTWRNEVDNDEVLKVSKRD
jgi:hypothetical protein